MLTGPEKLVLQAVQDLPKDQYGNVHDAQVVTDTWLTPSEVMACLVSLDGERFIEKILLADDHLAAHITAKGTLELNQSRPSGNGPDRRFPERNPVKIVPKGLRSFDEGDKDFFLQLLPGPDRNGVPESIQFWKTRIEETDPDKTFKVGVIFGPSGCGKSSLVKAGLVPRLAGHVAAVYIEATPDDTENRLLKGLRKVCPDSPDDLGLADFIESLRTDEALPTGRKVLMVIDQFEQWLHARRVGADAPILDTLRRCDGEHVQALLMVRDDFSMALHRFLKLLEVRLEEGKNFAFFDLFDLDHSKTVLIKYGQAFGKLPEDINDLDADQQKFLQKAIQGLARDGLVVSVRLAVFAEMVKSKAWTLRTLDEVGGMDGIGVAFLEKTFGSPTTNPGHRIHQKAARAVLLTLLPEGGTDIKGHMRSYEELQKASDYAGRPDEFDELLEILVRETRLITPTESENLAEYRTKTEQPGERYYQLTHDYLVPSIREWLTTKQRETRRGRAQLLISELAQQWKGNPKLHRLPGVWEWLFIRLFSDKAIWTTAESEMMNHSERRIQITVVLVSLLPVLFLMISAYSITKMYLDSGSTIRMLHEDIIRQEKDIRELHDYYGKLFNKAIEKNKAK